MVGRLLSGNSYVRMGNTYRIESADQDQCCCTAVCDDSWRLYSVFAPLLTPQTSFHFDPAGTIAAALDGFLDLVKFNDPLGTPAGSVNACTSTGLQDDEETVDQRLPLLGAGMFSNTFTNDLAIPLSSDLCGWTTDAEVWDCDADCSVPATLSKVFLEECGIRGALAWSDASVELGGATRVEFLTGGYPHSYICNHNFFDLPGDGDLVDLYCISGDQIVCDGDDLYLCDTGYTWSWECAFRSSDFGATNLMQMAGGATCRLEMTFTASGDTTDGDYGQASILGGSLYLQSVLDYSATANGAPIPFVRITPGDDLVYFEARYVRSKTENTTELQQFYTGAISGNGIYWDAGWSSAAGFNVAQGFIDTTVNEFTLGLTMTIGSDFRVTSIAMDVDGSEVVAFTDQDTPFPLQLNAAVGTGCLWTWTVNARLDMTGYNNDLDTSLLPDGSDCTDTGWVPLCDPAYLTAPHSLTLSDSLIQWT